MRKVVILIVRLVDEIMAARGLDTHVVGLDAHIQAFRQAGGQAHHGVRSVAAGDVAGDALAGAEQMKVFNLRPNT